ncbi:MAG: enoyl-CoA hydratase/isomerase family protein [Actinomycetota bacterium]
MQVARWSAAEARAAIASADLDRRIGAAIGVPAVVVDLETGDDGADIAAALAALPVIGISTADHAAADWDLAEPSPDEVLDGVLATPLAAVTTAQTLRRTAALPTADGLFVESIAYATLQGGPEYGAWLATQGRRTRRDDAPRVRVDDDAGTAVVTLTRGRLRNLLDARMRDELVDALRALALDPGRPIRLVGDGPGFCAGGDPAEFGSVSDSATAHLIRASANVAPHLVRVADRTEAIVHGPCIGAGVELAAFCSRVVARPDARFRLPETSMGLMPGAGGTVSIPRRIGRRRTLAWLLRGDEIDAASAFDWGLVDEIRPDGR